MNLISIDAIKDFLSYRLISRHVVVVALLIIFSPGLASAIEGDKTEGVAGQEIGAQGGCEAVCQLPDQPSKAQIPPSPMAQAEVKNLKLLR